MLRPDQLPSENTVPSPRNLRTIDDERLIFSSRERLIAVDRNGGIAPLPLKSRREIVAIHRAEQELLIVHDDGEILRLDASSLEGARAERRCGNVTGGALLPWLGSHRLLLAAEEGPVYCVGLEDGLVTQYLSPHRGLRMLAAANDIVAAASPDRQRILLWQSWDGARPIAEIHLTSLARHRVADLAFG